MKPRFVLLPFLFTLLICNVFICTGLPSEAPITIRVPTDETTIQNAIDAAGPSDVIGIADGTYTINQPLQVDKSVIIRSEHSADDVIIFLNNAWGGETEVIKVTADFAMIDDITVEGNSADLNSVIDVEADYCQVSYCVIQNSVWTRNGILALSSTGTDISYNEIIEAGPTGAGIMLSSCIDCTVNDNYIHDISSYTGIDLVSCYDILIENNEIINAGDGIHLSASYDNRIKNNDISLCTEGIELNGGTTTENTVSGNTIDDCSDRGIIIYDGPSDNIIKENTITNVDTYSTSSGIRLGKHSSNPENNEIYRNTIQDNSVGCYLDAVTGNFVYLNNFIDNTDQYAGTLGQYISPEQLTYEYQGNEYTGYLGNYWSDYSGVDVSPVDGIGDTTYTDGLNDIDYYPLIGQESLYTLLSSYALQLTTGWNLVSLPVIPEDTTVASVMSGITGYTVKTWSGSSYTEPSNFEAGKGYWIKVTSEETVSLTGTEITSVTLNLETGYNVVGGPNSIVQASDVLSGFYVVASWSPTGYVSSTSFEPGTGYLVFVLSENTINIP